MASPNPETDSTSMFMAKPHPEDKAGVASKSPSRMSQDQPSRNATVPSAEITIKDFFDFMRTAYQVYEHLEGGDDSDIKIDWEELNKLTILNHGLEHQEKELLQQTEFAEHKPIISKSDTALKTVGAGDSCRGARDRRHSLRRECSRTHMHDACTAANITSKLDDVINEGILDSILPYVVGYKKPTKTTSCHQPVIKRTPSASSGAQEVKKPASYGGLVEERPSRDRLGRRKSSLVPDRATMSGDVEIHVCDEVKGLKKDFHCPQRLLVSKMGYFADVTSGQKLEDMDISVHCDIQIFDWLMRWVKRDTILIADWPLLSPSNVIPILVSASFLQMEPLLHDCLIYCHAHMNEIVKTSTNLACLSDTLLTRLAAMYTNMELEAVKDRKDKIQSRLYCKMIVSLAEPVLETLRGHYATLATLFKCGKCNKLLGRNIAESVPCQPSNMRIDQRGNVLSKHIKDATWNLSDYIVWLHGELRSWRRVYWRLWGDCHFLKCVACESYFPAYQMEWCCHHAEGAQFFTLDGRPPLPIGRYPCCGERAYRFELVTRNTDHRPEDSRVVPSETVDRVDDIAHYKTGCQFREHAPDETSATDAAVMDIYRQFRETVSMRPPQLMFPERLTRLVAREPGEESGRLQGKEVFWWEGLQLAPPREPLGLLGKLYTGNTKFNPLAVPGPVTTLSGHAIASVSNTSCTGATASAPSPDRNHGLLKLSNARNAPITTVMQDTDYTAAPAQQSPPAEKKGPSAAACAGADDLSTESESSETSESSDSSDSGASEEEAPAARTRRVQPKAAAAVALKCSSSPRSSSAKDSKSRRRVRGGGRQWVASLSARSNQDGQRRFEERALRQMKVALSRRGQAVPPSLAKQHRTPPGGVYAKLEAEWRELHCPQPVPPRPRAVYSARQPRARVYK